MPNGFSTARLDKPKLATIPGEGYSPSAFHSDLTAALPVVSLAIAVASGVAARFRDRQRRDASVR